MVTFAQATTSVSNTMRRSAPRIIEAHSRSPGGVTLIGVSTAERPVSVAGWSRSIAAAMSCVSAAACAAVTAGFNRPTMCSQRCVRLVSASGVLPITCSAVSSDIHTSGAKPHVIPLNVAGATPMILTGWFCS